MSENKKQEITLFSTLKYLLKFIKILIDEKIEHFGELKKRFILYRDAHFELPPITPFSNIEKSSSSLKIKSKREIVYPLLILFDAENMPIQDHYRQVEKMVKEKFGAKSWLGATLEAAYKESTEFYNNRGYNQSIRTHYVDYGEDKADDKLIEIAKERKIPNIIIVTNDRGLTMRLETVANRLSSGKLFVFNGSVFKEYTLSKEEESQLLLTQLKEKQNYLLQEYNENEDKIALLEKGYKRDKISHASTPRQEVLAMSVPPKKIVVKNSISENLKNANLDKNIRNDLMINPLFINFTTNLTQVNVTSLEEAKIQAHRVLEVFEILPKIRNLLESKGLDISVFKIALRYAIEDFNIENYDFVRLVEFIQHVIKGSNMKLVLKEPSQYKLILKTTVFNELDMSEVLEKRSFDIPDGVLEDNFRGTLDINFLKNLKT